MTSPGIKRREETKTRRRRRIVVIVGNIAVYVRKRW